MKQHVTILVTSHNELARVHEARRQMITKMKNSVTLLRTETIKFDKSIRTILKQIASQIMQTGKKNEDSTARIAIASLENDKSKRIVIFCCVNISNESTNPSSNMAADVVPATIGIKPKYKYQRSAQTYKITGFIKDQLEWVHWNSSTPITLQDLQWRSQPNEESYRQQFLETFYRYNANLRALGNYYAAETCRYTIIQNNLLACIGIMHKKSKCSANADQSWKFSSLKDSPSYRIILMDDERSNTIAERHGAVEARSEFEKSVVNENTTASEMESLKKENELLGSALRKAADVHISMLSVLDANLTEKDKWLDERRAIEENCNDLLAKNEQLRKLTLAQTEELERLQSRAQSEVSNLRETGALEEQRRCIENDRQNVLAQKKEVERLQLKAQSEATVVRMTERLLDNDRRDLEQDRILFLIAKKKIEKSKAVTVNSLLNKEQKLEETERSMENQRRALESDQRKVSEQRQELEDEANRLRETQRSMDARIENLENSQRQLLEQKQEFEEYCEASTSRLGGMQRAIEEQRRDLERQRRNLMEERLRQGIGSTRSNGESNDDGYIEIPVLRCGIKIRPWK